MRTIRLIRLGVACFFMHALASAQALPAAQPGEPPGRLAGNETRLCINAGVMAATDVNASIPTRSPTTARQGVLSVLQSPLVWMPTNQTSWQAWCACLACGLVLAAGVAQSRMRLHANRTPEHRHAEHNFAARPDDRDAKATRLSGSATGKMHGLAKRIFVGTGRASTEKDIRQLTQQMEQQAAILAHLASQLAKLHRAETEKTPPAAPYLPDAASESAACGTDATSGIGNTAKKPSHKAACTVRFRPAPDFDARHPDADLQGKTDKRRLETPADRAFVERFRQVAEAHLSDENFGVNELLRELGISRTRLHCKLKAATGQSAHTLLRDIRMQKATHLLRTTGLPVAEVAARVGFGSPSHFAKVFGEYFGSTPSATREQAAA